MSRNWIIVIVAVITLGVIGAGVYFFKPDLLPSFDFLGEAAAEAVPQAKEGEYVAVFLSNNQVYFGKISNLDSQYPVLSSVYYLRVQRSLEPSEGNADVKVEDKNKKPPEQPNSKNELTLIKLGSELHGPTDEIKLNREHILYIEQLKPEGKVVKAILEHQAKKQASN